MLDLTLPHQYKPRKYQLPFWQAFDSGAYNRFYLVWHRRAGKDLSCLQVAVRYAAERPCIVTYAFPLLKQAREVLWEGMDNNGHKFIDYYIPPEIVKRKNNTTMSIEFFNGSILRMAGADDPDSLRGGNSKLFIVSEWPEHDPYTWTVIRPIIRANGGVVIFNGTPNGDNHGKLMFEKAQKRDNWFVQRLTVDDTDVFDAQGLAEELAELMAENGQIEGQAQYDAEYMCSFDVPVVGSYYGQEIRQADAERRITHVPLEATLPVFTAWDLGIGDSMAIWFYQQVGQQVRMIDYLESNGQGIDYYVRELRAKPYTYAMPPAFWPHDGEVRELGTGKSRKEVAESLGLRGIEIVPNISREDGIQAVRSLFSKCWFDKEKCERGLQALKNYKKVWDERNKVYRNMPKHDWASNGADAFRYLALSHRDRSNAPKVYVPPAIARRKAAHRIH